MYERTIPLYTFSKSYAMTGAALGYFAIKDATLRARAIKVVAYTTSNVNSVVQYGGIGALEGLAGLHRSEFARSCARGAICSTRAGRRGAGDLLGQRRPTARSTRS